MKTLIFGAGNILLSDEGFGVHAVRYLEERYDFSDTVELYDGGTHGITASHKLEEADRIYVLDGARLVIDRIAARGRPTLTRDPDLSTHDGWSNNER